jgi:predicted ATP-grasp superfamily ATP-dependent carboligase
MRSGVSTRRRRGDAAPAPLHARSPRGASAPGPPGVLVLATEFRAGPWACRSLARAGFRVVGAHPQPSGGRSLACPRPLRYPQPADDPDGFVAAVRAICRQRSIAGVLPVSEDAARVLAEREPDLGGALVVGPTRHQYERLCDKGRLVESAARAGVAHPETARVAPDGQVPAWPPLPSIVKPRVSGESLTAVSPAILVSSDAERVVAIEAVHGAGLEPIVQELVHGQRWSVHGARGKGLFRACAIEVVASYPRGVGTSSVSRTKRPPRELLASSRRLLDLVDYRGPCSFNFIERGGRFLVHDVNLRLSASVGLSIRSGLDVPRLGVAAALGLAVAEEETPCRSVTYVRTDGELRALVHELLGRGMGERARGIAARLALGVVSPVHMLDPLPLEPFWLGSRLARRATRLARRGAHLLHRSE